MGETLVNYVSLGIRNPLRGRGGLVVFKSVSIGTRRIFINVWFRLFFPDFIRDAIRVRFAKRIILWLIFPYSMLAIYTQGTIYY